MCLGLQYLHANRVLHRDIKSANIFLDAQNHLKLGDLGVAKQLVQTFAHTTVGTPYYMSPELVEEKPYNHKSDIWALGCVLYEMCTQTYPFNAKNFPELGLKILRKKPQAICSSMYNKVL